MKIKRNLLIELVRDGEFMTGSVVMDGVKQFVRCVPRDIESETFFKYVETHVIPRIESGLHGNVPFKKGKTLS